MAFPLSRPTPPEPPERPKLEEPKPALNLEPFEDPALNWRVKELVVAGCSLEAAEKIALDRTVDLHDAVKLFHSTTHDLAEAILL
jgi:hypothetical protein